MRTRVWMAIGDDDQDILMWNRIKWGQRNNKNKYPLHAVQYFSHFEEHFNPILIELSLNYRSTINIIKRANSFISTAGNKLILIG